MSENEIREMEDYKRFCVKCGWNDPDYGCISPPGEDVWQCDMYAFYHPEEVEKFEKAMHEWVRQREVNIYEYGRHK